MRKSPFIDDPREAAKRLVKSAVESPMEEVAAIHLEHAIHQAAIAKESGLTPPPNRTKP